eukprot:jgi/Chlat1/3120/Chrsp21S03347
MKILAYLSFNGDCEAAFKFYERCLGGKATLMTHKSAPIDTQVPPEWENKIMHAALMVGNEAVLMGGDPPPSHYTKPQGFCVNLSVDKAEEAEKLFQALSEGGTVTMPLAPTFWAQRFGMFTDRFGIPWMINSEAPAAASSAPDA